MYLSELIVGAGFAESRKDAKRKIEQRGVRIYLDGVKYTMLKDVEIHFPIQNFILNVGKINFIKISVEYEVEESEENLKMLYEYGYKEI